MIELSIALITYNSEDYIEETLNSIVNQKCTFNFEIVVGDDNSTDKTFEIIKRFNNQYPHLFKIKKNENQLGILKNFKSTIDRCSGKYVFNFDGDDVIKKNYALEKLIEKFREHPNAGLVDSGYDKYFESTRLTKHFVNKKSINISKDEYREYIYLGKIIPIGTCFKRDLLKKHVDFNKYIKDNITIEDYPTLVDMIANCDFERVNESMFIYRIHEKSYSYNIGFERYYFQRMQMLKLFQNFANKYSFTPSLVDSYEKKHYKTILYLAGSFRKKQLGKETFPKIKSKNTYDYVHYFSSQYKFIRWLVGIRKLKNKLLQKVRTAI